jgi:hypothetical protein
MTLAAEKAGQIAKLVDTLCLLAIWQEVDWRLSFLQASLERGGDGVTWDHVLLAFCSHRSQFRYG